MEALTILGSIGTVFCIISMIISTIMKKGTRKKWVTRASICFIIALVTSAYSSLSTDTRSQESSNAIENVKDQIRNITDKDNQFVQGVKNAQPEQYPDKTYDKAFSSFFGNPAWKYFESTSGEKVVEFSGFCKYQDTDVKAIMQFIISNDGETFEIGALSFNDVPQDNLTKEALLTNVFKN